jgi:hypothetical protein
VNEDTVRALLTSVAEDPEPLPSRIDVDAARRAGRRQRITRVIIPAAVATALAAGLIVTVPHALSPRAERDVPPAAPTSPAMSATVFKTAPVRFNPLTAYASFGWLPAGYSPERAGRDPEAIFSNTFRVTRSAMAATGAGVSLTVNVRGRLQEPGPTSPAPPVNGRTAYWTPGGLSWEYAPGGWAEVGAEPVYRNQKPVSGLLTHAELEKIASHVTAGPGQPYRFLFQVSSLPVGWHVNAVYGSYISGHVVATDVELIDKKLLNVVSINANPAPGGCNIRNRPGLLFTQWRGVTWAFWAPEHLLCASTPVNGLGSAWLGKGTPTEEPARSVLAGITIFLKLVTFLGPSPANWATSLYGPPASHETG